MAALTVLVHKMLEIVERVLVLLCLLCKWHKEAHKEQDHHQENEADGVLESTPESASKSLRALRSGIFVILLIKEVRKGYHNQAEKCVKRV